MKLGLDLDGVLVDWDAHWRQLYEHWFDRRPKQSPGWNAPIDDTHFADWGEFWTWAARVGDRFWEDTPIFPGVQGFLCELADKAVEVHVITNRPGDALAPTKRLVINRLWPAKVEVPNLHLARDRKTIVDCDIYVDDNPARLDEYVLEEKKCVRISRPWNEGHPVGGVEISGLMRRLTALSKMDTAKFLAECS